MHLQVRLTTGEYSDIQLIIGSYLSKAEKYLVFRHQPKNNVENVHWHIYLFNINITDEAVRDQCRKYLAKEQFCVKTKCGRKNNIPITFEGAYIYATNPKSDPLLKIQKGFTEEMLASYEKASKEYYDEEEKEEEKASNVIIHDHYYPKQDKTWEMLKAQQDKFIDKNIKQIKSMICAQWLNNGKAIPRPSDLHRYSVSLFYLLKFKDEEVPEYALEKEFAEK